MYSTVQNYVFPFIKQIGEGRDTAFSRYMKDTVFLIPTAKVLAKVVDSIDAMDMNNKDIMGDVYEYLLGKIASAGENGQFRTPRHIIRKELIDNQKLEAVPSKQKSTNSPRTNSKRQSTSLATCEKGAWILRQSKEDLLLNSNWEKLHAIGDWLEIHLTTKQREQLHSL